MNFLTIPYLGCKVYLGNKKLSKNYSILLLINLLCFVIYFNIDKKNKQFYLAFFHFSHVTDLDFIHHYLYLQLFR